MNFIAGKNMGAYPQLLGKINSSGYCGALVALINNLGEAER
jgi:hypothetical protein